MYDNEEINNIEEYHNTHNNCLLKLFQHNALSHRNALSHDYAMDGSLSNEVFSHKSTHVFYSQNSYTRV